MSLDNREVSRNVSLAGLEISWCFKTSSPLQTANLNHQAGQGNGENAVCCNLKGPIEMREYGPSSVTASRINLTTQPTGENTKGMKCRTTPGLSAQSVVFSSKVW